MSEINTDASDEAEPSPQQANPSSDFILAAVLWVIVLLLHAESIRLTFFVNLPAVESGSWLIAPGMLPLVLTGGLLVMLTIVLIYNKRQGALRGSMTIAAAIDWCQQQAQIQLALQAGLLLAYVFVAIDRLPFAVATGLYLFTSLTLVKAARMHWIVLLSILIPMAISWLFGDLMKLPLP